MNNMATVNLKLEDYNDLLKYKEAYDSKSFIIKYCDWTYGCSFTRINVITLDKALILLIDENEKLINEIDKIKKRKWWKKA